MAFSCYPTRLFTSPPNFLPRPTNSAQTGKDGASNIQQDTAKRACPYKFAEQISIAISTGLKLAPNAPKTGAPDIACRFKASPFHTKLWAH